MDSNCSTNGSNASLCDNVWEEYNDYYNIKQRVYALLHSPYEVIMVILGICAVSLNLLVFAGLYRVKNRLTTHYRLIISLAASDLLIGGSVTAHIINKVLNPMYLPGFEYKEARLISSCSFLVIKALNSSGLNVTLLNLMVMALDHYVAIMKPLQYPAMMTKKRVGCCIVGLWTIAVILGFSDFFSGIAVFERYKVYGYNYCEVVWDTSYQDEYTVLAVAPVCFIAMFCAYLKIYIKVRKHQRPGEILRPNAGRRTPKALITTLLNLGSFIVTWIPLCLFQIILLIKVRYNPAGVQQDFETLAEVDKYLFDLLLLNSISDCVIYTVRLHEVQVGLRRLFRCPLERPRRMVSHHSGSGASFSNNNKLRSVPSNASVVPSWEFHLLASNSNVEGSGVC